MAKANKSAERSFGYHGGVAHDGQPRLWLVDQADDGDGWGGAISEYWDGPDHHNNPANGTVLGHYAAGADDSLIWNPHP